MTELRIGPAIGSPGVSIRVDGKLIATAADLPETIDAAMSQGYKPLSLADGDRIVADLSGSQWFQFLSRVVPMAKDDVEMALDDEFPSYDNEPVGSVELNGEAWGWFRDDDTIQLIPKVEGDHIVSLSAWMSASMTGLYLRAGVRAWGPKLAIVWFQDDESNPEGGLLSVRHSIGDWDRLLYDAARALMSGFFEPFCPLCSEDGGWEIELTVTDLISNGGVVSALDLIWEPCTDHQETYVGKTEILRNMAGRDWYWSGNGWKFLVLSAPESAK